MGVFYIVISCVFVLLLIGAIVLLAIESRLKEGKKKAVSNKINSGKGMRIEETEDVYLKVKDGKVEIVADLPTAATQAQPAEESQPEPVVQPMVEDQGALEELVSKYGEITEDSVMFQATGKESKTFADKYNNLPEGVRGMYTELSRYILAHEKTKVARSSTAETFKLGTDKIVRVFIRRNVMVLNFMLFNSDLNRFVKEEGIKSIKINPVVLRLETEEDLALAKQTVDITVENIKEEQKYRKLKKKEQRKAKLQEQQEQQG